MSGSHTLDRIKEVGTALAFLLYPLCAGFAFAVHPNLMSLDVDQDIQARITEFHGNSVLHFAHVFMVVAVPLLIVIALHMMHLLHTRAPWWGFVGGLTAISGAVILALDKGALCLTVSAFDTLSEVDFQGLRPGIEAMFQYQGWLWLLRLLPLLPIGFIVLTAGLVRTRVIPRRQSVPMLLGTIMMANPDIDLVGLIATILLGIGFVPYAIHLLRSSRQEAPHQLVLAGSASLAR